MARSFNGLSDYIEFDAPVTAYPLTICAWIKPASDALSGVCVAVGNSAGTSRVQFTAVGTDAGDPISAASVTTGGDISASAAVGYTAGIWQFAAGVFASATSRIARVGSVTGPTNTTSRAISGLNKLTIGARYASGVRGIFYAGDIAEVAAYSNVLTTADLDALSKGFSPARVRPDLLVFYAPLVRGLLDVRGGRAATVSGTSITDHPRIYS